MMALLALPVAQAAAPFLADCERELKEIANALVSTVAEDEPVLLERLTELEAAIALRCGDNDFRFGAAAAYYELVNRRIAELREQRVPGLQTIGEFIERRLAPAMNTCRSIAARQDRISARAAGQTQLLSTRVALTRERQNQAILQTMNRRADIQLRLQSTVEGLSVAAVTYYVVGLVAYGSEVGGRVGPQDQHRSHRRHQHSRCRLPRRDGPAPRSSARDAPTLLRRAAGHGVNLACYKAATYDKLMRHIILLLAIALGALPAIAQTLKPGWITDAKGCRVWNPNMEPKEAIAWSGACARGAMRKGTALFSGS
jgi:hypothetical protein